MTATVVGLRGAPRLVGMGEQLAVFGAVAREAARKRPQSAAIKPELADERVGKKPHHAPVAVVERMNPREAVMARADGDNALNARKLRRLVAPLEMPEHFRDESVGRPHVRPDLHVAIPQLAGSDGVSFSPGGRRAAQIFGKLPVETPVQLSDKIRGERRSRLRRRPALHLKMRERKLLKVALSRLGDEFLLERGLDVADPRLLALDEVRVVAVHPTCQLGDLDTQRLAQFGREAGGALGYLARRVLQRPQPMRRQDGFYGSFCEHFADFIFVQPSAL